MRSVYCNGVAIRNFIVSIDATTLQPDHKRIFYLGSNGLIYCHATNIAHETSYCKNNPAAHTSLGPSTGLKTISRVGNQMTWKNSSELLISNGQGEIYQYNVPLN